MLLEDDQMMLGFREPQNPNPEMLDKLKEYFKKRKCAFYVKIISMTIYNAQTTKPLEAEHFCLIIKPNDRFVHDKDTYAAFEIMKPYIQGEGDFVDFSVLGYKNTMQINDEGKGLVIYQN